MNLVMIIAKYGSFIGGAEIQAERMAQALVNSGHQVTVLTRRFGKKPRKEVARGVNIVRLPSLSWGRLAPLTFMLSCLLYILWHRATIDLLHAHQHDSAYTAAIAGEITGIPVIAHFHGGAHDLGSEVTMLARGRKGKIMLPIVKKNTGAYIAVSNNVKEDLLRHGLSSNIYVLPNGVDTNRFSPVEQREKYELRQKLSLPENKLLFIFSGRLEPVKGVDLLLAAWLQLQENYSEAALIILGSGSMQQSINDSGAKNCYLRGNVDNVAEYLRAADIYVMPSRYEGTSLAVLEAMACQLPVLLTSVGGNVDLITDQEDGILIPPENPALLALWMQKLIDQPALRKSLGENARHKVLQKYSFSRVMVEYEIVCRELCGTGRFFV